VALSGEEEVWARGSVNYGCAPGGFLFDGWGKKLKGRKGSMGVGAKDGNGANSDRVRCVGIRNPNLKPESVPNPDSDKNPSTNQNPRIPKPTD